MRIFLISILVFFNFILCSASWQQQVDYDIHCKLDDQRHTLTATMKVTYHNHSGQVLNHLMLHTWMNVFHAHASPYSKQLDHLGSDAWLTMTKEDEGGYTYLKFDQNQKHLDYRFIDSSHEILSLELNQSCLPADSVSILVEFKLDIPKNISRGGHLGQSYQMTQWYPKIALFDTLGWHTMPYLEIGEFFNEFGDYKVTIELPSNYRVASTGLLQSQEEIQILNTYADSCVALMQHVMMSPQPVPPSSVDYKSIEFIASHVIDFAWFADKSFLIIKNEIEINHHTVQAWSYFYPHKIQAWKNASTYAANALKYFTDHVGPYPYPQVTVVECARDGSDGMEYPMITLIDHGYDTPAELEKVILHEVGHNWFQAILANNEREHGWMDEGLITYYEHRYATSKGLNSLLNLTPWTMNSDYEKINDFYWYVQAVRNRDISSSDHINKYTTMGFLESVYEKPAKGLAMMEKMLGIDLFDTMMKSYFSTWQFRHPTDSDLMNIFRTAGMDWFERTYLSSERKVNVSIAQTPTPGHFIISHDQKYPLPVELAGYNKDQKIFSRVILFNNKIEVDLPTESLQYLILDPDLLLPEIIRSDNIARLTPSPYAPKKIQFHGLPGIGHSITHDLYINPIAGYNVYDGLMPGLTLHNLTLPATGLQFAAILGYGLRSKKLVTQAGIEQHILIHHPILDRLTIGSEIKLFSMNESNGFKYIDRYLKIAPVTKLSFKPSFQYAAQRELSYRPIYINMEYWDALSDRVFSKQKSYWVHEIKIDLYNHRTLHPFGWNVTAEMGRGFRKLYSSYKLTIPYHFAHKKSGELRLFAGIMQQNKNASIQADFRVSGTPGYGIHQNDYKFDELLFGRNESSMSISQQIFEKDAGIYTLAVWPTSDTWMASASYRTMIPGPLPLMPFVQLASYPARQDGHIQFLYNIGVSVILLKNIFELNVPFFQTNSPTPDAYGLHKTFLQRCRFTLNLKALSPFKWIDRISS